MKLGIIILVFGVVLLLASIPFSIWGIVAGVSQMYEDEQIVSGGFAAWAGLAGVIIGFALTTVGATRVFKR